MRNFMKAAVFGVSLAIAVFAAKVGASNVDGITHAGHYTIETTIVTNGGLVAVPISTNNPNTLAIIFTDLTGQTNTAIGITSTVNIIGPTNALFVLPKSGTTNYQGNQTIYFGTYYASIINSNVTLMTNIFQVIRLLP